MYLNLKYHSIEITLGTSKPCEKMYFYIAFQFYIERNKNCQETAVEAKLSV